ncbi:hypothetical protein ACLB2K_063002 [Fragaria x ananassa]
MSLVVEEYDGLKSPTSIPMDKLYFWVGILNMPKALEKDRYIKNTASVASKYICKDEKLFATTEQIRVRVSHALDGPFYGKKTLKIINGVVAEIIFQFENLIGLCKHCNLIQHENDICVKISNSKEREPPRPSHLWYEDCLILNHPDKTLIPRITARALGLLNEGKSSDSGNGMGAEGKKKRGRSFGLKNLKNLKVEEKKEEEGGVTMQAGNMQPSPNPKGKGVL